MAPSVLQWGGIASLEHSLPWSQDPITDNVYSIPSPLLQAFNVQLA